MEGSPSTADKLVRLAELESRFQQTLEAEKLEAMAEFAAGAGHEINNPLTVISGRAQLLLRDEPDPERRHALALISAQAMRVYEMIADMMLFARPPRPELQQLEVIQLIDRIIVELSPRCARQGTTIRREGSSNPVVATADPVQIDVAFRAICQNSLEALQDGGQIEISVEQSQHPSELPGVRIRIHDDGPGIKPDERRHIFDPFYSARQAGRGLGLGLSKAWRIVTNHGGTLDVESQPGHGSTFTIVLRAHQ
jgi:signal transduction histidine kinase